MQKKKKILKIGGKKSHTSARHSFHFKIQSLSFRPSRTMSCAKRTSRMQMTCEIAFYAASATFDEFHYVPRVLPFFCPTTFDEVLRVLRSTRTTFDGGPLYWIFILKIWKITRVDV